MRRLRNTKTRKVAPFGTQEAATLAAAGINAAATLVSAGLSARATKDSAKQQSDAINAQAIKQANAMSEINQKNKELQEQNIEFMKEENAENRAIQKDMQMQLQMAMGQQNNNDRLEASKIKVKCGGKARKLAKGGNINTSLLRGFGVPTDNLPFTVTDGGKAVHLGTTNTGDDLYELYGNDHEHYHKTSNGKSKSGVGIKFADGNEIEGEGNQNSSKGEKMLVTPTNAYFISKHSIKGFNPANAVDNGMDPMTAFNLQESIKSLYGIKDDGSKVDYKTPVEKRRRLARTGTGYDALQIPDDDNSIINSDIDGRLFDSKFDNSDNNNSSHSPNYQLIGAGINAAGNLGGAIITSVGNRKAARTLGDAYMKQANIMADAYRNLQTIDLNSLSNDDFRAAHAMATVQAPVSQAAQALSGVDRQLQRRLSNAGKYSASGASALARMSDAEIDAQDAKNKIYSADQELMQKIRQANANRITETAMRNAELDTQALHNRTQTMQSLRQYNNDIANERIMGVAESMAQGIGNVANIHAQTKAANANAFANALTNSSKSFADTLSSMAKTRADYENVLVGANTENKVSSVIMKNDRVNAKSLYDALLATESDETLDEDTRRKARTYITMLNGKFKFNN